MQFCTYLHTTHTVLSHFPGTKCLNSHVAFTRTSHTVLLYTLKSKPHLQTHNLGHRQTWTKTRMRSVGSIAWMRCTIFSNFVPNFPPLFFPLCSAPRDLVPTTLQSLAAAVHFGSGHSCRSAASNKHVWHPMCPQQDNTAHSILPFDLPHAGHLTCVRSSQSPPDATTQISANMISTPSIFTRLWAKSRYSKSN